jgi:predicted nucleotide-binding protein
VLYREVMMVKIGNIVIKNSPTVITDIYTKNEQYGIESNQEGRESQSAKQEIATTPTKSSIFIVHGRDNSNLREVVARLLEKNGFEAIILNQKQNEGLTIIEKFEKHASTAAYAIVLLTPDDLGGLYLSNPIDLAPRARQNVFFEMGYFYAKLGREKVCTLYQEIEVPSDLQGVLYIPIDSGDEWKGRLMEEIEAKLSV